MSEATIMGTDVEPYEEAEDVERRRMLGLRPVAYRDGDDRLKGSHPDQRPCPAWCWVAQHPEYDHEIDVHDPTVAHHTGGGMVTIVASQYKGDHDSKWTSLATIEARMDQVGQADPTVKLYLRDTVYTPNRERRFEERLRLSVADARELVTVLNYLIEQAEA